MMRIMCFSQKKLQTVPPWVHMFLLPIAWLDWPFSYAIMALITWATTAQATRLTGGKWWYATISLPSIWEIWSGQIEWMIIIGMVLAIAA